MLRRSYEMDKVLGSIAWLRVDFCPIVPVSHLQELGVGPTALVPSNLTGDSAYASFYRRLSESGARVILDHGAYETWPEGRRLPALEDTLDRAEKVRA